MTKELIEKLSGHTDHIVGLYLLLVEKYALIDPMFFGKQVVRKFGHGERGRGFDLIRKMVYFGCLQDLVNICFDNDRRTPSICKLIEKLKLPEVQKVLRQSYSQYSVDIQNSDSHIRVAWQRYQRKQEKKLEKRFDQKLKMLIERWNKFETTPRAQALKAIRCKITAHFELEKKGSTYSFIPIARFGLKWLDLKKSMIEICPIIELLNLIIRNAGMDMTSVISRYKQYGKSFWKTC